VVIALFYDGYMVTLLRLLSLSNGTVNVDTFCSPYSTLHAKIACHKVSCSQFLGFTVILAPTEVTVGQLILRCFVYHLLMVYYTTRPVAEHTHMKF
jgi:hypothetical protein